MTRAALAAAALVLGAYVLELAGMPRHTFWSPDEGAKLMHARTIRFDGGLRYVLPYPGEWLDPDLHFFPHRSDDGVRPVVYPARDADGRVHLYWPLWFPLLTKVPLDLFGVTGAYLIPLFAGWLTAVFSGLLAREVDARVQAPAILVVGLATPVYFYSLSFYEHTLAAALGLLAVLLFVRGGGRLRSLLTSLPLLFGAALFRIESVALMLAVGAAWVVCALRRRAAVSALAPGRRSLSSRMALLVVAIALAGAFLASLPARRWATIEVFPGRLTRLAAMPNAAVNILINSEWDSGVLLSSERLTLGVVAMVASALAPFVPSMALQGGLMLAGLGGLLAFSALLVSEPQSYRSLHGFLPVAPFMILAACAMPAAWRRPQSPQFVFAAVCVLYLLTGMTAIFVETVDASGTLTQALQWGQRYLLALYPLMAVMSLVGLRDYCRAAHTRPHTLLVVALAGLLIVTGFLLQRRGIDESVSTRRMLASWQEAIEGRTPIVTDIWWLPAALAEFHARQELYVVDGRGEIGNWVELARAQGVPAFVYASFAPIPQALRFRGAVYDRASPRIVDGLYLVRFKLLPLLGAARR